MPRGPRYPDKIIALVAYHGTRYVAGHKLAENLWAVHSNLHDYAAVKPEASAAAAQYYDEFFISTVYETEHPVVRVLASGERSLVLGYFFRRFVGLSQSDSNHLFEIFQSHITRPEKHGALALERGRRRDVGQYRDPALRHQRLRR
jgi:alpha-ketoglutarate-dependent taurine dioxygenase